MWLEKIPRGQRLWNPTLAQKAAQGRGTWRPVKLPSGGWRNRAPFAWRHGDSGTEIFGAVTGNFVLQTLALGGIYLAGGIAVKILPKLQDGTFFKSFCGANKLAPVLARIPISMVVNQDAPILGAAYQALSSVSSSGPSQP